LIKFEVFMGNNSARLQWPYSNPNYTLVRWATHTLLLSLFLV
jgi:hypothetical protein